MQVILTKIIYHKTNQSSEINFEHCQTSTFRSSRPEVFCKKGVQRNFAKFTGKHLCQSFFFNKVVDLRPATLFKKRLWHRCFPVNFAKFLRTFFIRTPLRLFLYSETCLQNFRKMIHHRCSTGS